MDFYSVQFDTNWVWDPCYNAMGLLKDRCPTISRSRQEKLIKLKKELDNVSPKELLSLLAEIRELSPKMKEQKLLAWYLYTSMMNQRLYQSNKLFEHRNWLALFDKLHLKASGKLKVQKIDAFRVFCASTPELRHYFSVEQHNLKRMHKFLNPQQVMIATNIDVLRSLHGAWTAQDAVAKNVEVYYPNFDVKHWSQSFVSDVCNPTYWSVLV